jgi:hypothetical protein
MFLFEAPGRTLVLPAHKRDNYAIGTAVRIAFDPAHVTALPQ